MSQWNETLDLVLQGKGVWGEHATVGEVVVFPGSTEGYLMVHYVAKRVWENGVLSAQEIAIEFARAHKFDFTIMEVCDEPEAAIHLIDSVKAWNAQCPAGDNAWRFTRQALPAIADGQFANKRLYLGECETEASYDTPDALPSLR